MKKRMLSVLLALFIAALPICLSGCGKKATNEAVYLAVGTKAQAEMFEKAAKLYKDETGKTVEIKNTAIKKDSEVSAYILENNEEYEKIKDECLDLNGTKINSYLLDESLAKKDKDGKIYALPYEVTGYGIIYNKEITDKYFNMTNKGLNSISEIKDYKSLKRFAEDLKAKSKELDIESVFASAPLKADDAWEWHSIMFNTPLYYEFSANDDYKDPEDAFSNSKEIDFRYDKEYKDTLDLYVDNSTDKTLFETKTSEAALSEFSQGKAVMIVGNDKIYDKLKKQGENKVKSENLKFLPLYLDVSGDKTQGITVKRERYIAINKNADSGSRQAALDFFNWLFSSKSGKEFVSAKMGILTPFNTFGQGDLTENLLKTETKRYLEDNSRENVLWVITEPLKDITRSGMSMGINAYIAGEKAFDEIKTSIKERMKKDNR